MKVYISGPIATLPLDIALNAFQMAEDYLEQCGHEVVNPCKIPPLPGTWGVEWHTFLRKDIRAMMDCDAIFMLGGWQQSAGAQLERDIALRLNFKIWYDRVTQ